MYMIVPSSNSRARLLIANWFASYQLFCFVLFYHVVCDSTTVCWGTSSSVGYTEDSETQSTNCLFQVVVLYFLLVLALRFYGHTAEFRVLGANLTATQI